METDTGTQTQTHRDRYKDTDTYKATHRHTHRYTQTHTQIHTDTHTQTHTHTDTHTHQCQHTINFKKLGMCWPQKPRTILQTILFSINLSIKTRLIRKLQVFNRNNNLVVVTPICKNRIILFLIT